MYEELKKLNVEHYLPAAIRAEYEALLWDLQIQEDAASGKLDKLLSGTQAARIKELEAHIAENADGLWMKRQVAYAMRAEAAEAKIAALEAEVSSLKVDVAGLEADWDTQTAKLATAVKALEGCISYIASPLRLSDDNAEATRRGGIVERARAALKEIGGGDD